MNDPTLEPGAHVAVEIEDRTYLGTAEGWTR
jgi:hypothetical protein